MPLTPAARALIDALAAEAPAIETLTPEQARRASDERRSRAVVEIAPVHDVTDRLIPGPGGPLTVRVYRPSSDADLPAVVFFHGGGWVMCDLESHDAICRQMANEVEGLVVSVDYRCAPEHRWPAAAEDAYAATVWVAEHAADLGIDVTRIAVAGDSAGGNLAAVVTLMARDRRGPQLAFQLLVYPVTDHRFDTTSYVENADGYYVTRSAMQWYWSHYLGPEGDGDHHYVSPLRSPDLSGLPPALIITAEFDPLRDEGLAYADRLESAGVDTTASNYPGMFHGFFTLGTTLEEARRANSEAFGALVAALAPSTNPKGELR